LFYDPIFYSIYFKNEFKQNRANQNNKSIGFFRFIDQFCSFIIRFSNLTIGFIDLSFSFLTYQSVLSSKMIYRLVFDLLIYQSILSIYQLNLLYICKCLYLHYILNFVFTIVFFSRRWTKQDHTFICFKEFLNQLNLFYIYICLYL
jgi:hypothetical protein